MARWTRLVAMLGLLITVSCLPASAATLDDVRSRGFLVCGSTNPLPGFAQRGQDGLWSGFDVDFCRAVAAAVLGDPNAVEFRALAGQARFALLQTGAIDLLARNAPWSMRRDTQYGAGYVGTSFFDGQGFLVSEQSGFVSAYELNDVSVCVVDTGDDLNALREFFFSIQASYRVVPYEDREDLGVAYRAGLCDVISAEISLLQSIRRGFAEPARHRLLPERISKAPLGPMVRQDDPEWFDIVRWTLFTLINAEEVGLTSVNLESMAASRSPAIQRMLALRDDFGARLRLDPEFMIDIISAVGNYGELYERNFGGQTGAAMVRGQNALWTQGGLLFAPPVR